MNKKLLSTILVSSMTLSLALTACGGGNDDKPTGGNNGGDTDSKGKIALMVGSLGDKSFSDSAARGMEVLRSEGWDVKTVETGDAADADKYDDFIRDTLDQGYTYLVGSGSYAEYFYEAAKDYPDAYFLTFDETRDDLIDHSSCIFYAQNEGSYLVGMLAAGMSETGAVAVNVGMENPVINDFVTGFIQGVKDQDPNCKVYEAAVGSWSDPVTMKNLCLDQQRNNNVDVFYQVAGGSGDGLFEAAMETGTWAIGVDSDQYQAYKDSENPDKADVIMTSMLKEVGNSLVAFFHRVENGEDVWGQNITLGLADDSVGYVDNDYFKATVPEDLRNAMADAAVKVKSGELKVKSYYDFASEAEYMDFVNAAK